MLHSVESQKGVDLLRKAGEPVCWYTRPTLHIHVSRDTSRSSYMFKRSLNLKVPVVTMYTTRFNIQRFCVVTTVCVYVLLVGLKKQRLFPFTASPRERRRSW